jgi:hypothetical protein
MDVVEVSVSFLNLQMKETGLYDFELSTYTKMALHVYTC